ncbi:50S ribosomal protein L11 methyltransferase [Thermomicrobium sp. CFH 73360]|uniref:50S ribosomal protein L11 methyltransferase n=1 Tax=Thermomicrobium sp. CFH 73360 TaxID=2951987 RepID=UPI002076872A|nr:50S ribosomal protein L11 methyltransferase [Thermomicrobium sp. CFH 73360]MCM8745641.1 50S ribosomal protein L11 methyltransferase [Thermomicrobium sp. CFH 73360]
MSSRWLEVSVEADLESADAVAELFARFGYQQGVAVFHPVKQAPDGEHAALDPATPVRVTTYLPLDEHVDATVESLRQALWHLSFLGSIGELQLRTLAEEDWAEAWKQHFPVTRIGHRLVIRPSWLSYTPQADDVVIDLDPGMAFGTGLHPTTQHCLIWIERIIRPGDVVLDAGAGSGILSIAALKLGAASVTAIELDPVASDVLRANLTQNGVLERATVRVGDVTRDLHEREAYDLVLANIVARVLIHAAPRLVRAARPGASIVLSGIIASAEDEVRARYRKLGAEVVERRQDGDWVSLLLSRTRP